MAEDLEFSEDYETCAVPGCREPAPYRLWRGDVLLAHYCHAHNEQRWQTIMDMQHAMAEATEAIEGRGAGHA